MVKDLVIKCRGLPYSCDESELRKFFGDSGIDKIDLPMKDGRAVGDATVHFNNDRDYNDALKKDREHMGHRYIEVFPADSEPPSGGGRDRGDRGHRDRRDSDRYGYSGGGRGGRFSGYSGEGVVRLRGLPYGVHERDIYDFFAPLPIVQDGVLLADDRQASKTNGEAYVVFADQDSADRSLQRHMKNIQHRYIEVFASSYPEMVRFCDDNRLRVPRGNGGGGYGPPRGGFDGYGGPQGYGGGPQGYPSGRGGHPVGPWGEDYEYPQGGYNGPAQDPYTGYGWGAARSGSAHGGPEPLSARQAPSAADPFVRGAHTDPYGRPVPQSDPYGRPAAAPQDDPYMRHGRPRQDDPYGRARGPDIYDRSSAATGDPYSRNVPQADTWRDDQGVASGYGESGWDGYGYGNGGGDYRQSQGGGPMRARDQWRDEGRGGPREGPRGRERPGQKYVLKMRGVPFRAVEGDVYDFFEPIRPSQVEIMREPGGRPSGEARVEFDSRKDYDDALLKDKQYMGSRYVELFPDFGGRY